MEKFFYFGNGTSSADSVLFPVRSLIEMSIDGDGDALTMRFHEPTRDEGATDAGTEDMILEIAEDSGKTVMNAIADEVRYGNSPFIVVYDDNDGEALHASITAVSTLADISS